MSVSSLFSGVRSNNIIVARLHCQIDGNSEKKNSEK